MRQTFAALPQRIETRDADAVVAMLSRILAPHEMDMRETGRTIRAQVRHVAAGPCRLADLTYGAPVRIRSRVPQGRILVHAVAEGRSRMALGDRKVAVLEAGMMHVSPPGSPLDIAFESSSRHFTANLPSGLWPAVSGRYDALAGGEAMVWIDLMRFMLGWAELGPGMPDLFGDRAERLITEFLRDRTHVSRPEVGAAVPWFVKQAKAAIAGLVANGAHTISLCEIAADAGVSVRTLQSGFRRFLGHTFGEEVREQRLERLDHLIVERGDQFDVTALMQACGIVSMGRFAGYYRDRFGVAPSDRLRRRH
ncbi:AraC family transcriptional regulator [Novosphingobium guangzhouense]|uniref:HTH araC/xylS-type domain-containing protein n=1 Tax=Novosphingobium guangzhouense TaxID=1850347 RepID=A0A2K2G051_9SPHN|nr:AraC family transcriptional regulator [Novosphingobium guangzhouense]PNU04378.1 hypothetical protein A8V01_20550 [Novosphingobium guangzhouense]